MKFDFGYAWMHVICVLGMIIVWLLVKRYTNNSIEEELRQNEERFREFVNKLSLTLSCEKVNNIICSNEKFIDEGPLMAVFNDIIDRKVEATLHKSKELLTMAAELAHLGPWQYHHEKMFFEFEDEFYVIYGTDVASEGSFMTLEEYIRKFVYLDDANIVAVEIEKIFMTTERRYTTEFDHRIIKRDGDVRTVAVQGNIIKDATGKIIKWYGGTQDITEQKQTEAALCQQMEKIRRIAYTDALTGLSNRAEDSRGRYV